MRIFTFMRPLYKNIDAVIDDLIKADLIDVVATLRPIITYKMRKH
ncbi:hypothetical protein D1AOALGA4SA_8323 [Olavius algarvensis Delta 1 endosymbiont]|nr:hypothetical protein D1AOALGA4SA_8323 [Olavius algarvensis Delta 1 endosymbiont]